MASSGTDTTLSVRVVSYQGHGMVELKTYFEGEPATLVLSVQQARMMADAMMKAAEEAERQGRN